MEDYTYLWYDVRPHPQLRHRRDPRAATRRRASSTRSALAALIQAMVKELCEHFDAGRAARRLPVADARREQVAGRPPRPRGRARRPALQRARRDQARWRGACVDRLREHAQDLGSAAELDGDRRPARPRQRRRSARSSSTRPITTSARSWPRSSPRRRTSPVGRGRGRVRRYRREPCPARPISSSSARTAGSEVSPYITECPYCGTRLRKRAPKIERDGRVSDKDRRPRRRPAAPRLAKLRAGEIPGMRGERTGRPWATIVARRAVAVRLPAAARGESGRRRRSWATPAASCGGSRRRRSSTPTPGTSSPPSARSALFGWLLERRHGPWPVLALFVVVRHGRRRARRGGRPAARRARRQRRRAGPARAPGRSPTSCARSRGEDYEGDLLGTAVIAARAAADAARGARRQRRRRRSRAARPGMLAGLVLARARIH